VTALYLRASTRDQTESIDAQRMLLERYAADHKLQIGPQYEDFAISGDSFNGRPGLQQLLADAKAGKFQAVLVRQLSRLSRRDSLKSAAQIVGPLLDAGVTIYTASHGDLKLDSATGRIMLAVLSEFDHAENVSRAMNVLNGHMKAAAAGSWIGPAPFGYRIEGAKHHKRLVLGDPEHVAIVRRAFELYAAGESCDDIAALLNAEGAPSPNGKGWQRGTLMYILRRPVYCGDYRYNHKSHGKYYQLADGKPVERRGHWIDDEQERPRQMVNSPVDWVVIRDHWPAIVSRELWDRVNARMDQQRASKSPSATRVYVLTGMLRCSCGSKWAMSGRHKGGKPVYRCDICGATVSEAEMVATIGRTLRQSLTPEAIAELRRQLEQKASQPERPAVSIKVLETKLAKYERRLLECSGDMVPTVEKEIRSLRHSIDQARRQAHNGAQQPASALVDAALAELFRLPEALSESEPKALKARLSSVLDSVSVQATSTGEGPGRRWRLADGEASFRLAASLKTRSPSRQAGPGSQRRSKTVGLVAGREEGWL
jgi:DNA invertase Pin-like site-specific DNA recombinase